MWRQGKMLNVGYVNTKNGFLEDFGNDNFLNKVMTSTGIRQI